ncbi:MAG: hypothetical protein R3F17_03175 [Planctomycetota bacterium]
MSYDIEVKSDEDRSESLPIARLREVIADMTGFTESGPESFTFESGNLWMGLDCELMNAEGDSIGTTPLTTFNTVSVHIPYGYLGNRPERHYFPADPPHRRGARLGDRRLADR